MFHLAQTAWPRFGGDQANRSLSGIAGPHAAPTWQKISLLADHAVRSLEMGAISGVLVVPDETLRVCHSKRLSAVALDGTLFWQLYLRSLIPDGCGGYSLPTALQTGETLLVLPDGLLIVDRLGGIHRKENRLASDGSGNAPETINAPDDSGYSPK